MAGVDWRIDKKNALFGVLPGHLTWQHKVSYAFAYGAIFRAQTNSYSSRYLKYARMDENQFGAYADLYLTKNVVLNAETGHSLFRKLRTSGSSCACTSKYIDQRINDNLYFKTSVAYRLSLDP